ncbi:MAG: hypothetical protein AAFW46_04855 [Pseudomonadota bacterium]
MSKKDSGGPAFPTIDYDLQGHASTMRGMTKRDLMAAHALTGLLANPSTVNRKADALSADAYVYADAMIVASKKMDV